MSSNRTGFFMFVGILSILLVICGVILWSQTTTEWSWVTWGNVTMHPHADAGFILIAIGVVGIAVTLISLYYPSQGENDKSQKEV